MTLSAPERIREDSASTAIVSSVHGDIIRIAPKKSYSMGGHDYTGVDYHGWETTNWFETNPPRGMDCGICTIFSGTPVRLST